MIYMADTRTIHGQNQANAQPLIGQQLANMTNNRPIRPTDNNIMYIKQPPVNNNKQ